MTRANGRGRGFNSRKQEALHHFMEAGERGLNTHEFGALMGIGTQAAQHHCDVLIRAGVLIKNPNHGSRPAQRWLAMYADVCAAYTYPTTRRPKERAPQRTAPLRDKLVELILKAGASGVDTASLSTAAGITSEAVFNRLARARKQGRVVLHRGSRTNPSRWYDPELAPPERPPNRHTISTPTPPRRTPFAPGAPVIIPAHVRVHTEKNYIGDTRFLIQHASARHIDANECRPWVRAIYDSNEG